MALYALEEARRDPAFIKAQAIAVDMDGMEEEIRALEVLVANRASAADEPEKVLEIDDTTSDSARRLLDEFERLSRHTPTPASKPKPKEPAPAAPKLSVEKSYPKHDFVAPAASDTAFGAAAARLEQLKKEYAAKAARLQRALDAMVPDEEAPPEIKRNYSCARMITTHSTVTRKEVSRVAWVCNRCNVRHNNPSECAVAEYGGRWEVQEIYRTYHTVSTRSINI